MQRHRLLLLPAIICLTAPSFSQGVVFPLHVGDRWEYDRSLGTLSQAKITHDTLMPNGLQYAVVDSTPNYGWPLNFKYLRRASDTVYHFNPSTQGEELLYRFNAIPGDTLLRVPTPLDTFVIIFHFQQTVSLFGVQRRQWTFGIYPMHFIDIGQSRTITDSLGLTDVGEANGGSTLRGAVINGVTYGNITAVMASKLVPKETILHQNYPNPFNPKTIITFDLPSTANVNLGVYDLLGQRVQLLVAGPMAAGRHDVEFVPTSLATGVYLYRLQTNGFTVTKKLILTR